MSAEPSSSSAAHQHHESTFSLPSDSYTAQRLQHATPNHLYLTTRRCFIGPIPEGWLKSHRREWYERHLHIHYASTSANFSAGSHVGRHRSVSGLDAPGTGSSFPRPADFYDEEEENIDEVDEENNDVGDSVEEATLEAPPALQIPRSEPGGIDGGLEDTVTAIDGEHGISESVSAELASSAPYQSAGGTLSSTSPKPDLSRLTTRSRSKDGRRPSKSSFVTALERLPPPSNSEREVTQPSDGIDPRDTTNNVPQPSELSQSASFEGTSGSSFAPASSSTSLIRRDQREMQTMEPTSYTPPPQGILSKMKPKVGQSSARTAANLIEEALERGSDDTQPKDGTVRFDLPESARKDRHIKQRLAQMPHRRTFRKLRRGKIQDGEIIKMEKMLVRVERTSHEIVPDFDESESGKIESTTFENWREYMVVCRQSVAEETDFTLHLYKTRAIPAIENAGGKSKTAHLIPMNRSKTKINLYSALDKTMVLWVPYARGTLIYIMQPRSSADSMEWYTFLRNVLGSQRSSVLQIHVPDLNVSLQLEDPFNLLESAKDLTHAVKGDGDAIQRTIQEEHAAAANIIRRCQDMLEQSKEYGQVVKTWAQKGQLGLAWKRYDRLEWIHGQNEMKMYGTMGMLKTHELELRPKQHYPTTVKDKKGRPLTEPPPVEGFLVRLTSQRGIDQKLGRLFFKRLYFSTHSQFLVFNRPARADPPPPPKLPMQRDSKIPTAHQIAEKIPLIYSVNPFPVEDGEIDWLRSDRCSAEESLIHNLDAHDESERKLNLLLKCDGNIDLTNVVKVRNVQRGATPADANIDSGSDVDFDESVRDTEQDDGTTREFDDARTFELMLRNGLVVRLQAFNAQTKNEWKHRLRALAKYWSLRAAADVALHKSVRSTNLARLNLDAALEATVGQYARKWEVTHSHASSELYHMCVASACRAVSMSGTLYRKPRLHASFARTLVILSAGHLLVFRDALRSASGAVVRHIHHERVDTLDLRDCYIYSGRQTENDVLYEARGFDPSNPDRRGLPRLFGEDGWTSMDDDAATCFVVWRALRKGWFLSQGGRSSEPSQSQVDAARSDQQDQRAAGNGGDGKRAVLKRVSALGVEGRSVVFKARSRAERDQWVVSIANEIGRLGQVVDGRVVGAGAGAGGEGGIGGGEYGKRDKGKGRV